MDVLIASNNRHKIEEITAICESIVPGFFKFFSIRDIISEEFDVEETGTTLIENAILKAEEYYKIAMMPVLADDTGLEVKALNYAPGVYSARYAGIHGDDAANREKILSELGNESDRYAHFKTVLCFFDGKEQKLVEGVCKGEITFDEKGENGFGYDPIFIPEGFNFTFAELKPEEKNQISHRYKAVVNFANLFK